MGTKSVYNLTGGVASPSLSYLLILSGLVSLVNTFLLLSFVQGTLDLSVHKIADVVSRANGVKHKSVNDIADIPINL